MSPCGHCVQVVKMADVAAVSRGLHNNSDVILTGISATKLE